MSSSRITYTPRPDATPEGELNALTAVYAFILRCSEARRAEELEKGTRPGAPDDAKGLENDRAKTSIHE